VSSPRRKYRPPDPGPLRLRESVRRALLMLSEDLAGQPELAVSLIEEVERALRCQLPDEILACFANGDATLPEWGFNLGAVADNTARARELGCPRDLVVVGEHPNGHTLYCVERFGDRKRGVGLIEIDTEANGDTGWRDLGDWLNELAGRFPSPRSKGSSIQLTLWPESEPEPRVWRLV
jgi:hypothetical protein